MTDDELRNAIGKAKGCTFEYVRKSRYGVECIKYNSPKFQDRWIKSGEAFLWPCSGMFNNPCPNWPRDIAAAWKLFEEMPPGNVTAIFRLEDEGWFTQTAHHGVFIMECGSTAPRSICAAWLAWKAAQ